MKTLLRRVHSLLEVLYDLPDVTLRNAIFNDTNDLFNTQFQQEADGYVVSVPVPGLSKEDLNVHIHGRLLYISTKNKLS